MFALIAFATEGREMRRPSFRLIKLALLLMSSRAFCGAIEA